MKISYIVEELELQRKSLLKDKGKDWFDKLGEANEDSD